MREIILFTIKGICEKHQAEGIEPSSAMLEEVTSELHEVIMETIRNLIREKEIIWHKTLNSYSLEIKGNGNDK